jgi:hypothetical protein
VGGCVYVSEMSVCVCVCVCVHVCVCECVCVHVCVCICVHVCVCMHVYVSVCLCMCVHACVSMQCMCMYMCVYVCICVCAHLYPRWWLSAAELASNEEETHIDLFTPIYRTRANLVSSQMDYQFLSFIKISLHDILVQSGL